ncbi:MAG: hypothetical protein F7C35_02310 [Desulfurococcales archaeon]|nr:hypothetical protein [Desulfurococcales archaeon]
MSSREAIKREILELIDSHWNNWVKAAFYSDPQVEPIMGRLVKAWRENGEQGKPLDYATDEELMILLHAARRYYTMDPRRAMAVAFANMSKDEEEERGPSLLGVFRKFFARGRRGASP